MFEHLFPHGIIRCNPWTPGKRAGLAFGTDSVSNQLLQEFEIGLERQRLIQLSSSSHVHYRLA